MATGPSGGSLGYWQLDVLQLDQGHLHAAAGTSSFTIKVTDASSQTATEPTSITIAAGPLTSTVPSGAILPSASPGSSTSAQLGTVTVNDLRGMASASWTATVTATTFVTGGATAPETIPLTQITYWSGPGTTTTGTGTFTPGQANPAAAVNLTVPRTAFTLTAGSSVNSAAWNPTLSVSVPASAAAGLHRRHHPLRGLTSNDGGATPTGLERPSSSACGTGAGMPDIDKFREVYFGRK